ncbi:MAG: hypothetical protein ACI9HK_003749 [Pirellulaceae bacterium]|jgi:hypothetical protein
MAHPLIERVRSIGRRAKRLVIIYGVGWFIASVLASALALGLVDFICRFQDVTLRLLTSGVLLAVIVWSFRKFVYPAIQYQRTEVAIAQLVERVHPHLRDRLSSAIEFLQQEEGDDAAGSLQLRQAVIAETGALAETIEFEKCIDVRKPRRAALISSVVAVAVGLVALLNWQATSLAAQRLIWPLGSTQWPRQNYLNFTVAPTRLAAGDPFEVELTDNGGSLPNNVTLEIWPEGSGRGQIQQHQMQPLGDKMVYRIENVAQPFRYRAFGGDDETMNWLDLQIVDPPRVESRELTLIHPAYTGWPIETVEQHIRALLGSQLRVTGKANRTIQRAEIVLQKSDGEQRIPLDIAADNISFSLSADSAQHWEVKESGMYWIELTDEEGLVAQGTSSWELTAVTDRPPTLVISLPKQPTTHATAKATVSIEVIVKDDLAIESVVIMYGIGTDDIELTETIVLLTEAVRAGGNSKEAVDVLLKHDWDLRSLPGLEPGVSIRFIIQALDNKPQTARSEPLQINIIAPEKLEDALSQQQSQILSLLAEALQLQLDSRQHCEALKVTLDEVGKFSDIDLAQMQSAELTQRQVQRLLIEPETGVASRVESILKRLVQNRLDNDDVRERMELMLLKIRGLGQNQLPIVHRELTAALKTARAKLTNKTADAAKSQVGKQLQLTATTQGQVIQVLESLLGQLMQWDSYQRVARDISSVKREQQEVTQKTDELRLKLLQSSEQLTPAEKAELKRIANRQKELARRFEQIQSRMEQMGSNLKDNDPIAAKSLRDALKKSRGLAITGQMRESARHLDEYQVGQANQRQQDVDAALEELLDALANRREQQLSRKIEQLKEAAGELESLQRRQQQLREELEKAGREQNATKREQELQRLSRQQQKLAEESKQMARRLEKLQAPQAARKTQQASGQQDGAAKAGGEGKQKDAADLAKEAEDLLEEAKKEVQEQVKKAEQDLFFEQLAKLEQAIEGLVMRQESVRDQTAELNDLRKSQPDWRREQVPTVRNIAAEERLIGEECGALAEKVAQAEAFALGLRGAMREMLRAAGRLDQLDTGTQTQETIEVARNRLVQLQEALKPPQNNNENNNNENNPGEEQQNEQQQPPADQIQSLAELKLLKSMQEEINRRTSELETRRLREGKLDQDAERELIELSQEQGHLADIVINLIESMKANPEDDPESLPELEPELESDVDKDLDAALLEGIE